MRSLAKQRSIAKIQERKRLIGARFSDKIMIDEVRSPWDEIKHGFVDDESNDRKDAKNMYETHQKTNRRH